MEGMATERRTLLALSGEWLLERREGKGGKGGREGRRKRQWIKGLTYHSPSLLGASAPTLGL